MKKILIVSIAHTLLILNCSYIFNSEKLIESLPTELSTKQKNLKAIKGDKDIFGYPIIKRDSKHLINALNDNQFEYVETYFNDLINKVKDDYRYERVLTISLKDVIVGIEFDHRKVEDWLKDKPRSSVPYMIMGEYYSIYAHKARGADLISETPADSLDKMRKYIKKSNKFFNIGLKYDKDNIAIYSSLITNATIFGSLKKRLLYLSKILNVNPGLYFIRANIMRALAPRWGGSYYLMELLADNSEKLSEVNPRMSLVKDMIADDIALDLQLAGEYDKAERLLSQHTNNDRNYFILFELGLCQGRQSKYKEAAKAYEKAIKLQPDQSEYYRESARANLMIAIGEKASNKRLYLENYSRLIKKAAMISPLDEETIELQKRNENLDKQLMSNDSLLIRMFGYWYLIEEKPSGGKLKRFAKDNTPQINQFEFDKFYNNLPNGYKKVKIKIDSDSTFYANSGGNSAYNHKYYLNFKNDTLLLSEINPKGGYYWEDKYLPYNGVYPPKHWEKNS